MNSYYSNSSLASNTLIIVAVLIILLFLSYIIFYRKSIEPIGLYKRKPSSENVNPKQELLEYFSENWARLSPYLITEDCERDCVPSFIISDFKARFGHYFTHRMEHQDVMLNKYANGTFERTLKMEFREICQTFIKLGEFIKKYQTKSVELRTLSKELERLHHEHFPQAVFISVIIERMINTFNKYPDYDINQISYVQDPLTISIISSINTFYNK